MSSSNENDQYTDDPGTDSLRDICVGLLFLAFSGMGWYSVLGDSRLMATLGRGLDPGPAFLPVVTLSVISLGGILILVNGIWQAFSQGAIKPISVSRNQGYAAALLLSLWLLPTLIGWIGFLPSSALFTFSWLCWLSYRRSGNPLVSLALAGLTSAVICGALYVIFIWFLKVPL